MGVLYIRDANGVWQAVTSIEGGPGEPGQKGDKGDPGHTPVRGVDYFTEADVQAMVDAVIAHFDDGNTEAF